MYQIGSIFQSKEELIDKRVTELAEASYLSREMGLYQGKAGILLCLQYFVNNFKINSSVAKEAIKYLQEDISENAGNTDDSFSEGIFGIGWAINTLYQKEYLTENKVEVMNSFDDELYKLVMYQKANTNDLEIGTMGRINYYLNRISEDLKITNKYRYVCNYESLMLLVDDFTTENQNIICQFESKEADLSLLSGNGKYYANIFNLLSRLVQRNIHLEITERQQLQFLRIFKNYFHCKEAEGSIFKDENVYWNRVALLNCLSKVAKESETIAKSLNLKGDLIHIINERKFELFSNVQEFVSIISFFHFLGNDNFTEHAALNMIPSLNSKNTSLGLNGFAGFLFLASNPKKNRKLLNDAFLI